MIQFFLRFYLVILVVSFKSMNLPTKVFGSFTIKNPFNETSSIPICHEPPPPYPLPSGLALVDKPICVESLHPSLIPIQYTRDAISPSMKCELYDRKFKIPQLRLTRSWGYPSPGDTRMMKACSCGIGLQKYYVET